MISEVPTVVSNTLFNLPFWVLFLGSCILVLLLWKGSYNTVYKNIIPWCRYYRRHHYLKRELNSNFYTADMLINATRYYTEPDCQSVNPVKFSASLLPLAAKENIFNFMDRILNEAVAYHHVLLLAEAGMGKSAFLLNYYARHLCCTKSDIDVVLIPLGVPGVDGQIAAIKQPSRTVLLLDGFDRDPLALNAPLERLKELTERTYRFKKVLITCRTHFLFQKSPYSKLIDSDKKHGKTSDIPFVHIIYLASLTKIQAEQSLQLRYPPPVKRKKLEIARRFLHNIQDSALRPILLSYIHNLIDQPQQQYDTAYALYQAIVDSWINRKAREMKAASASLENFAEQLANRIYLSQQYSGIEQLSKEDTEKLAEQHQIIPGDLLLTRNSLLNQDKMGNYKFIHRSIMEFLLVRSFIRGDRTSWHLRWSDQMQTFLWEQLIEQRKSGRITDINLCGADLSIYVLKLRNAPLRNLQGREIDHFLQRYHFFDRSRNKEGGDAAHPYLLVNANGNSESVVTDIKTGLMWQRAGSDASLTHEGALDYIRQLNTQKYAGYHNWRLPTLEEAMSLLRSHKKNGDLYIDVIFSREQRWIWSADSYNMSTAWGVSFSIGSCARLDMDALGPAVRAVRSEQQASLSPHSITHLAQVKKQIITK